MKETLKFMNLWPDIYRTKSIRANIHVTAYIKYVKLNIQHSMQHLQFTYDD